MRSSDCLPMIDVRHIHPRAHDVRETAARLLERPADVSQRLDGLRVWITRSHNLSAGVGRRRARNVDHTTYSHCARVADDRLPRRPAGDVQPGNTPPFHVICEGKPVAFASAMRSSVARTMSSTACGGLRNVTPPTLG